MSPHKHTQEPPVSSTAGDESSFTADDGEDAGTVADSWMLVSKRNVERHVGRSRSCLVIGSWPC